MVMITDGNGVERFSMRTSLYELTKRIRKKMVEEDAQVIGVIYGGVGCGKSVFAQHFAYAIDPTLDISRVCFNKDEFVSAVLDSRKQAIIADEGISLFFSRAAMTKDSRIMQELMAQCRQKNLCLLICVPNLLTVDSLILEAANFAVEVSETRQKIHGKTVTLKGQANIYARLKGKNAVKGLVFHERSLRSPTRKKYKKPRPLIQVAGNPIGPTYKEPWYPVGEEAYRKKKEAVLEKYRAPLSNDEPKKRKPMQSIKKELFQKAIVEAKAKHPELTDETIAKVLGYSRQHVNSLKNKGVSAELENE